VWWNDQKSHKLLVVQFTAASLLRQEGSVLAHDAPVVIQAKASTKYSICVDHASTYSAMLVGIGTDCPAALEIQALTSGGFAVPLAQGEQRQPESGLKATPFPLWGKGDRDAGREPDEGTPRKYSLTYP
jgi:hypothetical protein